LGIKKATPSDVAKGIALLATIVTVVLDYGVKLNSN